MASKATDGSDPGEKPNAGATHALEDSTSAADPIQSEGVTRIGKIGALTDISAIASFAARLAKDTGATVRATTLHKLVIEQEGEYAKRRGHVTFDEAGKAKPSHPDFAPTAAEAAQIVAEWEVVTWPTYQPHFYSGKHLPRNDDNYPWSFADPENVAVCWDRDRQRIECVEVRKPLPDGGKLVLIWSPFDDSVWRIAEPPNGLPLYGKERIGEATTIFIHEGPKAAKVVQCSVDDDGALCPRGGWAAHPWGRELRTEGKVAHVAWLGGAERPLDTDWRPLSECTANLILVLDNDAAGKDAASPISRAIGRRMKALFFTDQWPARFDLADEFPAGMFEVHDGRRVYVGPRFEDCLRPATWATNLVPQEGRGRPTVALRPEFAAEWIRSNKPPLYFHRDRPNIGLTAEEFNREARAFSDTDNTARLLDQRASVGVDGVTYRPGETGPVLIDKHSGQRVVQRWKDAPITAAEGSAMPFLRFLTHLVPVKEDRFHLAWWIAVHCACPEVRIKWSPILRSRTQGTGKTTVLKILADQTGRDNVSMPSETAMAESRYNGFIAYKRLVGCNEFYSNQSFRTYNKIKTWITDEMVDVEMKFIEAHTIPATAHFVLCSNEMVPILMDRRDRRFFVPTITEGKRPRSYWKQLYRWLDSEGPGIIRRWAQQFVEKHWDSCSAEEAPMSGAKLAMIEKSLGDEMRIVREIGEQLAEMGRADPPQRVIVALDDLRDWLAEQKGAQGRKRLSGTAIQEALRDVGLTVRGRNERDGGDERIAIDGRKQIAVTNFKPGPGEKWPQLVRECRRAMDKLGEGKAF